MITARHGMEFFDWVFYYRMSTTFTFYTIEVPDCRWVSLGLMGMFILYYKTVSSFRYRQGNNNIPPLMFIIILT